MRTKKNVTHESTESQCYSGTILNSVDQEPVSRLLWENCSKEAREEPGYMYEFFAGKNKHVIRHRKITACYKEQTFQVNDFSAFPCLRWCMNLEFPGVTSGKEYACHCRRCKRCRFHPRARKIPWRGGHGNSLQYSCLENPMDRGAWRAIVHGIIKNQTWLKSLSMQGVIEIFP